MSDLTPEELEQVLGEPVVRGEDGETVVVRFNDDGTTDNFVLPAEEVTPEDVEAAAALVDRSASPGATVPAPPEVRPGNVNDLEAALLAGLPQEPEDSETPPDPTPQTDKMHGPRGTPLRDAWDAEQRRKAYEATVELEGMPAYQNFAQAEAEFEERKEAYRDAFVKAQRKKGDASSKSS